LRTNTITNLAHSLLTGTQIFSAARYYDSQPAERTGIRRHWEAKLLGRGKLVYIASFHALLDVNWDVPAAAAKLRRTARTVHRHIEYLKACGIHPPAKPDFLAALDANDWQTAAAARATGYTKRHMRRLKAELKAGGHEPEMSQMSAPHIRNNAVSSCIQTQNLTTELPTEAEISCQKVPPVAAATPPPATPAATPERTEFAAAFAHQLRRMGFDLPAMAEHSGRLYDRIERRYPGHGAHELTATLLARMAPRAATIGNPYEYAWRIIDNEHHSPGRPRPPAADRTPRHNYVQPDLEALQREFPPPLRLSESPMPHCRYEPNGVVRARQSGLRRLCTTLESKFLPPGGGR
jgi:hypothetical protein